MRFVTRAFLAVDAAALLIALYFFFIGLTDGSVSSFNGGLWLALLGAIVAILLAGVALNAKGQRGMALGVLAILAVPALLAALFFAVLIVANPRWN